MNSIGNQAMQYYAQQYAAQVPMTYPPFAGQTFDAGKPDASSFVPRNRMVYGKQPAIGVYCRPRTERLAMPKKKFEKTEPSWI